MVVSLLVRRKGRILEAYELRCVPLEGRVNAESIRAETAHVLRNTGTALRTMDELEGEFDVSVGRGEVQEEGMTRIDVGRVRIFDCEVQCGVLSRA